MEAWCYSSAGKQKVIYNAQKYLALLQAFHTSSATVPPTEVTSDPALLFTATAITVFGVASLIHFFILKLKESCAEV